MTEEEIGTPGGLLRTKDYFKVWLLKRRALKNNN